MSAPGWMSEAGLGLDDLGRDPGTAGSRAPAQLGLRAPAQLGLCTPVQPDVCTWAPVAHPSPVPADSHFHSLPLHMSSPAHSPQSGWSDVSRDGAVPCPQPAAAPHCPWHKTWAFPLILESPHAPPTTCLQLRAPSCPRCSHSPTHPQAPRVALWLPGKARLPSPSSATPAVASVLSSACRGYRGCWLNSVECPRPLEPSGVQLGVQR